MVVISIAASPLHGAFAAADTDASMSAGHCLQAQNKGHSSHHAGVSQDPVVDTSGYGCDQKCGGDCCDGACRVNLHSTVTLPGDMLALQLVASRINDLTVTSAFSLQTTHPPFRPPITPLS